MAPYIIQWNANGFYNNLSELKLILNICNPPILCIQETHWKNNFPPILKDYNIFFKNGNHEKASGGVLIAIKNNLNATEIFLQTALEATAVKTKLSI